MPGSGKSYWARQICDTVIDDITDLSMLPDTLENVLGICDVNFCDQRILDKAVAILEEKYPNTKIEFFWFQNDPEKCRSNVKHRNDGRNVEGTLRRFEKIYNPPTHAKEIWYNANETR